MFSYRWLVSDTFNNIQKTKQNSYQCIFQKNKQRLERNVFAAVVDIIHILTNFCKEIHGYQCILDLLKNLRRLAMVINPNPK